ncbi:MAG: hydrogenase iron-sulfur subunit [Desulfobacterales bacterium]|nr:hydrogenase iron-sulfur subunit [Desulfobacterales bacterium]MCF8078679.1 hydrogenase iron-sulfur subunit [Desulfobacterales bacterium]
MRLSYPADIRIVRVPCTGKVDLIHILRAFEKGADGVSVVGCMEGDCHYNSGNFRAKKRVAQARQILDTVGIGADRVQMYNLSSSEGPRFARFAEEMAEKIRALGPNPVRAAANQMENQTGGGR